MGVPKRLTDKQMRFAEFVVFGGAEGPMTQSEAVIKAGYSKKRARQEASELRNPKQSPLVVKYIEELRVNKMEENKGLIAQHLVDFNHMIQEAKESLKKDLDKGNYYKILRTGNKFKEIFDFLDRSHTISVYLAEETRPYKTAHYKIGKTNSGVESRSTGRTDNPFGLNYICYFEYIPEKGFNLERTLHSFFKKFSTYNPKYSTSASEWFSFNDRKIVIKYFKKMGLHFLQKNNCMGRYVEYKDGGFYKK